MHFASVGDRVHRTNKSAAFDDGCTRVLGHESEHHIDTMTNGGLSAFDPLPVLFDIEKNTLRSNRVSNFGIQIRECQIKAVFFPFVTPRCPLVDIVNDNVERVGDIHDPSLLRTRNEANYADFGTFVVFLDDMPRRPSIDTSTPEPITLLPAPFTRSTKPTAKQAS
jgi:hypothetical protein